MNDRYEVKALDKNFEIITTELGPFAMPPALGVLDTHTGKLLYKTSVNGPKAMDECYEICDAWNIAWRDGVDQG